METTTGSVTVRLSPTTQYDAILIDQDDITENTYSGVSSATGDFTVPLPEKYTKYDGWFSFNVYQGPSLIYVDTITSTRPYVTTSKAIANVSKSITTEQATTYERLARELINSILGFDFSFKRKIVDLKGTGTDYLPVDERIGRIFSVKENGEYIWAEGDDDPFAAWTPRYAVLRKYNGDLNRAEYSLYSYGGEFRWYADYEIDAEFGWQVVPQDVEDAMLLLIEDFACGNNRYINKYIDSYGTGNVKIDYFREATKGTGNLLVDNILSKYVVESIRLKVL